MAFGELEHANISVSDPERSAQMMVDIFGWHIRWRGEGIQGGNTIHVGTEKSYVAIYHNGGEMARNHKVSYGTVGELNHLAVVVDDFEAADARVRAAGYIPGEHYDYEPGRRFYFHDHDGIEFELVCYD